MPMDDLLDALLDQARIPEPTDDGFTERVMRSVRVDAAPWPAERRRLRRFLTRPVVLGAAAIVVTSGAMAAVRTATAPPPARDAPSAEISTPSRDVAAEKPVDDRPDAGRTAPEPAAPVRSDARTADSTAAAADPDPYPVRHTDDDHEWGWTSAHSAYVIDHATGLELRTETYTTELRAGRPQRVTVTLTNRGSLPVSLAAADGCALSVLLYGGAVPDDPRVTDPAAADADACADPTSAAAVVGAGATRTVHLEVTAPQSGAWHVVGACRCTVLEPPDAATTLGAIGGLAQGGGLQPVAAATPAPVELFTPAVAVDAR